MMATLAPPNIADAIAKANQWVAAAKPVIRAYFAIDDVACDLYAADRAICEEARGILRKPLRDLSDMIDGIRDNYRCDHVMHGETGMTDSEWDAVEAFNEELERGMVSVAAAIKQVEAEL